LIGTQSTLYMMYPVGWIWGINPTMPDTLGYFGDWVIKTWTNPDRPPRLAYLGNDLPAQHQQALGLPYCRSIGVNVVAEEYSPYGAGDVTPQLLRIRNANPDYIFVYNSRPAQDLIVARDMAKLEMKQKVMGYGSIGIIDLAATDPVAKANFEGWYMQAASPLISAAQPPTEPCWAFYTMLYQKYRDATATVHPLYYGATTIAGSQVLEEAIKRALDKVGYNNLTTTAIKTELDNIKNFDTMGFTSPVSYTPTDHRGVIADQMWQMVNGRAVLVQPYKDCPQIIPQ
jgi:branched-chain amino acid transport system substrate-binding protein